MKLFEGGLALLASLVGAWPARAHADDARAPTSQSSPAPLGMAASLELHGGFFGLFNLNKSYTDADPSFGLTASWDAEVHRHFSLGAEYDFTWVRSVLGERYRLTMAPDARVRFHVALGSGVTFFVIAAVGVSIWPEDDAEPELDRRMRSTRVGLSLRVLGGCDYALDDRYSLVFGLGYAATSTYRDGLNAWVDNVITNFGASARF
ncbi:MAG: hypothetical protein U0271_14855 [Polyangiaceae bacterium]